MRRGGWGEVEGGGERGSGAPSRTDGRTASGTASRTGFPITPWPGRASRHALGETRGAPTGECGDTASLPADRGGPRSRGMQRCDRAAGPAARARSAVARSRARVEHDVLVAELQLGYAAGDHGDRHAATVAHRAAARDVPGFVRGVAPAVLNRYGQLSGRERRHGRPTVPAFLHPQVEPGRRCWWRAVDEG